ncbi:MAG: TIGR00159 family protein [Deltaproteobacteria bacterium]|nr:MAG: TIGR00159 family protein [Deltaproteobacteria bacterium]
MKELFASFRWQDGLDIVLLSVVIYWGLNLIRGTRAVPMLIGLGVVYGIYFLSNVFEVYTLNVLLRNLLGWSLVLVFIVFQDDIRRALTLVGTRPLFSPRERVAQGQAVEELIKALTYLASRRIGALVVLQNEVGLNQYIDVGTRLDAQVSKELVTSIFLPGAPIHDGALIIQRGRMTAAGCFLPLTTNPNVSKTLGTRHRAAIGLTEETDAAAIVVSEEDGMISLVREGKITRDVDAATLRTTLHRLLLA